MKQIAKIVLTGGPCGGKSTGLSKLTTYFTRLGWKVLTVSEAATEYMTGNAKPNEVNTVDFQYSLFNLMKAKEKSYEDFAIKSDFDKVLILCDRGAMDIVVYLNDAENRKAWFEKIGLSRTDLLKDYDAVYHLVTAAKGAKEYYTTENNKQRTETVEEAAEIDGLLLNEWTGHPHLRIIDNSTDFDLKITRLIKSIASFLGEPEPYEIEKKFLIKMPDIQYLNSLPNVKKADILQTYLLSDNENEVRVRQRGEGGSYIFTKTIKRKITGLKRVEIEDNLDTQEYLQELLNADTSLHQIRKTRYCISYGKSYLELDIYPFWEDKAILEIELMSEDEDYDMPSWIEVIQEVTDDDRFKNKSLAKDYKIEL